MTVVQVLTVVSGIGLLFCVGLTEISAGAFLVVSAIPSLRPFSGLIERGIYLGALLWLSLLLVPLLLKIF